MGFCCLIPLSGDARIYIGSNNACMGGVQKGGFGIFQGLFPGSKYDSEHRDGIYEEIEAVV